MNFSFFKRKNAAIEPTPVRPLSEVEQKLLEQKPEDWLISKIPCDENEEREFSIVHRTKGIRLIVDEQVLQFATAHKIATKGVIRCGPVNFGKRFTVEFGSIIYKLFLQREAESNVRDVDRVLTDLRNRLGIK